MDHQTDKLWKGGPWEQPSPSFTPPPAPFIPPSSRRPQRPHLVIKQPRRRWPVYVGLAVLILSVCLFTAVLWALDLPTFSFAPPDDSSTQTHQQEHSTQPPDIPHAETGTGVTLQLQAPGSIPLSYQEIYEKSFPSIVSIQAESDREYGTGTGIVLTRDGYILTNAHVVAGAQRVTVTLSNNLTLPASLVGFDAEEDLSVLKVDARDLVPAEFGDSSSLHIGEPVAAIGDPLGYRSTITDGIISSLDREVQLDGTTMVLIQTSAAINFGNSGGALINQYGQVVGVTTVKIVTDDGSAEALGFAIPSRRVKYVADTLIDGREVKSGIFGFVVLTHPTSEGGGLEILSVEPGSDAAAKGIQPGDFLLSVQGQPVQSSQDLVRLKLGLGPGDSVSLTLARDTEQYSVDVMLVDPDTLGGKEPAG